MHVISDETATKIRNEPQNAKKNTVFLDVLLRGSQEQLNEFIELCSEANQGHVARLFRCDTGLYTVVNVAKRIFALYFAV